MLWHDGGFTLRDYLRDWPTSLQGLGIMTTKLTEDFVFSEQYQIDSIELAG